MVNKGMTLEDIIKKYPKIFIKPGWHNCPIGWLPLLDRLCEQLQRSSDESGHQVICNQVKEKFSCLRFYAENCTSEQWKIIGDAEKEADMTCQNCGNKEDVSVSEQNSWATTLCVNCRSKE